MKTATCHIKNTKINKTSIDFCNWAFFFANSKFCLNNNSLICCCTLSFSIEADWEISRLFHNRWKDGVFKKITSSKLVLNGFFFLFTEMPLFTMNFSCFKKVASNMSHSYISSGFWYCQPMCLLTEQCFWWHFYWICVTYTINFLLLSHFMNALCSFYEKLLWGNETLE